MALKTTQTKPRAHSNRPVRINIDFPRTFLSQIEAEADRIGVPRAAFIKALLAQSMRQIGSIHYVDSLTGKERG